ncbi:hypothetical protein BUALT_Bualt08G0001000 [Buddleja alternifolia]|uniref:Uncharacterized protein n=1 Tax=Buddleja alternifolia TaxID=168488 RepID=A0AAV6X3V8_9LAMI|nr:hypothetical protein BUALT_Bualt08G0001000 [Buddleja alternifolia]
MTAVADNSDSADLISVLSSSAWSPLAAPSLRHRKVPSTAATPTPSPPSPAPSSATARAESASASKTTTPAPLSYSWSSPSPHPISLERCSTASSGLPLNATATTKKAAAAAALCGVRREATNDKLTTGDAKVLKLMQSVGLLPVALNDDHDGEELMYLRASFDRVIGLPDSESFHMINPVGSSAQELSVFLL